MRRPRRLPGRSTLRPDIVISPLIESSFVRPRAGLSGGAALRQLADDMRQTSSRDGGVSSDDLQLLGWTAAQLGTLAADARVLAQALARAGV